MKIKDAISAADALRQNAIPEETKYGWACALDADIADHMEVPTQHTVFPQDAELLMPPPHDRIYVLYLCAMIDFFQNDAEMYQIDLSAYNTEKQEALSWWIRNHRPSASGDWRV